MNFRHRSQEFEALRKNRLRVKKLVLRGLHRQRNSVASTLKLARTTLQMAALIECR